MSESAACRITKHRCQQSSLLNNHSKAPNSDFQLLLKLQQKQGQEGVIPACAIHDRFHHLTRFRKQTGALCIDIMTGFVSDIYRAGCLAIRLRRPLKWKLYIQRQLAFTAKSQSVNRDGNSVFYMLEARLPPTQRAIFRTHHLMIKCSWEGFQHYDWDQNAAWHVKRKLSYTMKWNNIYCFTVTHIEADKLQSVTAERTVLLYWCRDTEGGERFAFRATWPVVLLQPV